MRHQRLSARRHWTIARLIRHGARRFRAHGLALGHGTLDARDEAAYLARHALKMPDLSSAGRGRRLRKEQVAAVMAAFEQRIRERRPAAYLTNEAWLGEFKFYVDERAIIPRSYIAELLRESLAPWIAHPRDVLRALDLGAGSGCLAILLAHRFPRARIDATDVSSAALEVARRNVRAYRLSRRIRLVHSDLFVGLGSRRYDLIVSNPPYVRASVMQSLPPEYRCEPALALAGGTDGLDIVRRILQHARRHLKQGGTLVVEVGRNRRRLEQAYPGIAFTWAATSGEEECVFVLSREQLPAPRRGSDRAPAVGRAPPRRRAGKADRALNAGAGAPARSARA